MRPALTALAAALLGAAAIPCMAAFAAEPASPAARPADDPFIWLEDVDGARAMEWVKAHNEKAAARLEADPRFEPFRKEALAIFTAKDRIAYPAIHGGQIYNFWQDDAHIHGIWRRTGFEAYASGAPWQRPQADKGLHQNLDENEVAAMLWKLAKKGAATEDMLDTLFGRFCIGK